MDERTRAVVIEEMPLVRVGISSVLRDQHVAVVAESSSATDAAVIVRGSGAHLVVVGDGGDGRSLADVVARVKARNASVSVVVLVPRCTRDELLAVVDAGAWVQTRWSHTAPTATTSSPPSRPFAAASGTWLRR